MLSIFGKHYALTESGFGYGTAHEFTGTFNDAVSEFNYLITNEACELSSWVAEADEIIVETVLSGDSYRADIIIENVAKDLINKVKEIWKKLKEWIKGLIAKLETFILQISGQTNKWASKMESRVKSASVSDFKREYHRWDHNTIDKLCEKGTFSGVLTSDKNEFDNDINDIKSMINDAKNGTKVDYNDNQSKSDYEDKVIERLKKISSPIGISDVRDEKSLMSAIDKKVTGGEKITQSVDVATANRMLDFVSGAKDRISNIKGVYKELQSLIDDQLNMISDLEQKANDLFADDSDDPEISRELSNVKSRVSDVLNTRTKISTSSKKLIGNIGNAATKYVRNCSYEYMSVLTAYCDASDKQKKKK